MLALTTISQSSVNISGQLASNYSFLKLLKKIPNQMKVNLNKLGESKLTAFWPLTTELENCGS